MGYRVSIKEWPQWWVNSFEHLYELGNAGASCDLWRYYHKVGLTYDKLSDRWPTHAEFASKEEAVQFVMRWS